ncbi:MAG: hypothetical protein M2R45_03381 [Verrucomicrobia subdivision 3 bacterium]|nr:hypothetical protein [Limisphaerales bacterium]MCS1416706.1 hypothetical protein [Limisphaerales bacterium]
MRKQPTRINKSISSLATEERHDKPLAKKVRRIIKEKGGR